MTDRPPGGSSLSIVLPCLDEAERLPGTLAAYLAHFPPTRAEVELLVVDDGSTDGTTAIADQIAAADPRVRVVRTTRNHGKGYAVRTGIQAAQGELVVFTDADGSYGPDQLERVVAALERAPVAIGARLGSQAGAGSPLRRLASRVFNRVMRLLLGLPFHDTQCGLKGFRRERGRGRVPAGPGWTGSPSTPRRCWWPAAWASRWSRCRSRPRSARAARSAWAGTRWRMLADVWKVRRAAARGAYDETRVRDVAG